MRPHCGALVVVATPDATHAGDLIRLLSERLTAGDAYVRFLFCCDLYHPSIGGVQEVMRQIAERMVRAGHEVTVATRRLADRTRNIHNGVRIEEFDVSGDLVAGLHGEVDRYREFVATFPADAMLIKAAHQWSFDACWPVLERISARKVFIPCGFSQFYNPAYKGYFAALPAILRQFDHLIFYAEHYRDIDFVRANAITHFTILPNGASEIEFAAAKDPQFRRSLGIAADDFVVLTVGTPPAAKGHKEVAAAFARMPAGGRSLCLILNGDASEPAPQTAPDTRTYAERAISVWREEGAGAVARHALRSLSYRVAGVRKSAFNRSVDHWVAKAAAQRLKKVLKTNLPRAELVQAFLTADLFVCASKVEYSPLVLFEAAAAGTPFVTVPVGNAEEIVRWTGGGVVCPATRDKRGHTQVDPRVLAQTVARVIADAELRATLGAAGRKAFLSTFNWGAIAKRYEAVLTDMPVAPAAAAREFDVAARADAGRG
jgi:glycosyltransferase involved in cell wall biosynthesis